MTDQHTPVTGTSADREGTAAVCQPECSGDADAGDEAPTESVLIEALKLEDQLRTSAEARLASPGATASATVAGPDPRGWAPVDFGVHQGPAGTSSPRVAAVCVRYGLLTM